LVRGVELEVSAVSDEPEELEDEQLEKLHRDMIELVDELTELLASTRSQERPVELDQTGVGRLSRIDAMQQQQMIKEQRRRHRLRLQQLEAALARWQEGEYGWCMRCEEPIGYKRLEARPESPMCIRCLKEIERR
jgi:DnaK suppressor protein